MVNLYSKVFLSKSGRKILVRYPLLEDLAEMTRYINELSKEDTFIMFSGEIISRDDEEKYLNDFLNELKVGDGVCLLCFDGTKLIGSSGVQRDKSTRRRSLHRGIFGISIAKEYREQGIGRQLMELVMEEAIRNISGLKQVILHIYAPNEKAKKMYESFGFKEVGRIPGGTLYRGEYVDEIIMWKVVE